MKTTHSDFTPKTAGDWWLAFIGFLFGAAVGIKFADLDLRVPAWLLYHRAALTHGVIAPGLLAWVAWRTRHQTWRGITIGFCMSNALHLSFDLFPRAWWGHALIHLFEWEFPPVLSWIWIAGSIVACVYLARLFAQTIWDIVISLGGVAAGLMIYAHEGIMFPLAALIIAGAIAFILPFPRQREK